MINTPTTHQAVFDALLAKIRAGVLTADAEPIFNTVNLWLSDDPEFEIPKGAQHKVYAVVCPTDGQIGEPEFDGGGEHNIIEYTAATIVLHSAIRLAQKGKPGIVLTEPNYGLWVLKRKLIRALAGQYLTTTVDEQTVSLLIQPLQILHCERPTIQGQPVGDLALLVNLPFEWDLTADPEP